MSYRPAIDGLRSLAVLSVYFFHLNHAWMPGGFVGVDVFFVISGYLITSIIHSECLDQTFSLAIFYQRRIARIFPAFFTVAAATLLAAFWVYGPQDLASCGANLMAAALSVANLKLLFQGSYFAISPDAQPLLHYWSLSVEEQYYLVFPVAMLLLHRTRRRPIALALGIVLGGSLAACVLLTSVRPVWAFYLLPTRAWELCAGALLAVAASRRAGRKPGPIWGWIAWGGLCLIGVSLVALNAHAPFPGWRALFPVLGTVMVIGPNRPAGGVVERLLSARLPVLIGKLSYSLYLWHWPVFSFVDYGWFDASAWSRLVAKVVLSFAAAIACYNLVEKPARRVLNQPARRRSAFSALLVMALVLASIGALTRRQYYLNATPVQVARGGIVLGERCRAGSIALIGDSNGSMYGTALRDLAQEMQQKLTILSVAAGDPLPVLGGGNQLWTNCLNAVRAAAPDVVVLACHWPSKLDPGAERLRGALESIAPYTRGVILIATPPSLPQDASREGVRRGAHGPFFEEEAAAARRLQANRLLKSLETDRVIVIDADSVFVNPADNSVKFADADRHLVYQDQSHLSHHGARLLMPALRKAIRELERTR